MRKRSIRPALAGLTFYALLLAGCKGNSTGPAAGADLSGSYALQSLTESGSTLTPPVATGTLVLTATNYTVNLTVAIPGQPTDQELDAGTYTVSGSQWTQTSTTNGIQSVGTYTFKNGLLSVNVTTQGQATSSVWMKQ
jgi:hypothetical protein